MANQTDILKAMSTKEEAASPKSLASELRTDEPSVRTNLNRLKKKAYVSGGGSEWYITDAGRAALERGELVVTTKEDVGEDELSRFKYYGQLSGVPDDKVTACIELFQNTGMRSMEEMERVLAEMNVPQNQRVQWKNLYRGYLRNTTPPEKREELYPLPKPEEVTASEEAAAGTGELVRGEHLDYIVEDNDIQRVGDDLGMFTFRQALQVVAAKRASGSQKGEGEGLALLSQLETLGLLQKSGEEGRGSQIELLDKLNQLGLLQKTDAQASPGSFVDGEGNIHELKPGQPIVIQKVVREAGKTYLLNQEGDLEEHESGKPIIIKTGPSAGSNLPPMMPFPVMGSDGQPVYDKDGNPVYTNLEPMMKYMGFQNEQRRAEERHGALMGLVQTARENLGDGVAALRAAAEEAKGGTKSKPPESEPQQQQTFQCADCQTTFGLPEGWTGQNIKCPNPQCGREYTKEELLG